MAVINSEQDGLFAMDIGELVIYNKKDAWMLFKIFRDGRLQAWVDEYGYPVDPDNVCGERVAIHLYVRRKTEHIVQVYSPQKPNFYCNLDARVPLLAPFVSKLPMDGRGCSTDPI